MKIFISWSKNKSKDLAMETKNLIQQVFGDTVEIFFSPDMYKGTCVDREIHENLLKSDRCIVCITSENYKNPWLMYEAGVVYGAHYKNAGGSIVVPILFDHIPEWSSWIDKPLNRYVPIAFHNIENGLQNGKEDFRRFFGELSRDTGLKINDFSKHWNRYAKKVQDIVRSKQLIPTTCIDLVNQLLEDNDGNFTINSPEITKKHVLFHKGFSTNVLTRLLLKNVINYQGKKLWFFGRRNKKLMTGENDDFFKYLSTEGIQNGVDFRCLFPYPDSDATYKAVSKDKERRFKADLQTCLEAAISMENRFQLPIADMFRLYRCRRTNSIIISDDALLNSCIICDSNGYPLPITNSSFEILSVSDSTYQNKGQELYQLFLNTWLDSIPLTKELYYSIYGNS